MINKEKVAIILRGVSGCGKSSVAEYLSWLCAGELCGVNNPEGFNSVICTADDFFMNGGVYKFDPDQLGMAHSTCFQKFKDAINRNIDLVICANTNTRVREFGHYIDYAENNGYTVFTLIVENRHGGVDSHRVPEHAKDRQEKSITSNLKLR